MHPVIYKAKYIKPECQENIMRKHDRIEKLESYYKY